MEIIETSIIDTEFDAVMYNTLAKNMSGKYLPLTQINSQYYLSELNKVYVESEVNDNDEIKISNGLWIVLTYANNQKNKFNFIRTSVYDLIVLDCDISDITITCSVLKMTSFYTNMYLLMRLIQYININSLRNRNFVFTNNNIIIYDTDGNNLGRIKLDVNTNTFIIINQR
jgi:hypothetical protein